MTRSIQVRFISSFINLHQSQENVQSREQVEDEVVSLDKQICFESAKKVQLFYRLLAVLILVVFTMSHTR